MDYGKKALQMISCREYYKYDCNAMMKGRNLDEVVEATIKHGVSMHGLDPRKLRSPESRIDIGKASSTLSA